MFKWHSSYIYQKKFDKLFICQSQYYTPAMREVIENPDHLLDAAKTHYLKNNPGERTTVGVVTIDNVRFVIKRYNIKNFWHGIKLWFRKSRAMTSWLNAHYLQKHNIPSVTPVAVIENRFGILRGKAYFVYLFLDAESCNDYFVHRNEVTSRCEIVLKKIVTILHQLKAAHLYQRDCQHNNMLLVGDEVKLIDLDHMKKYCVFKFLANKAYDEHVASLSHYFFQNDEARKLFYKLLQDSQKKGCEDGRV